jgi:hypothetical protein
MSQKDHTAPEKSKLVVDKSLHGCLVFDRVAGQTNVLCSCTTVQRIVDVTFANVSNCSKAQVPRPSLYRYVARLAKDGVNVGKRLIPVQSSHPEVRSCLFLISRML